MGLAIDTVSFSATNPGAAGAAATAVSADSLTVRNYNPGSQARLDFVVRQGATEGFVRIFSPSLHDAVRGFSLITTETPGVMFMPRYTGQPLQRGDALTVQLSGGTAEVDGGVMGIYYTDLPGAAARLHTWQELAQAVKNIKPVEVDFNTAGTSMNWADTALNATENLLKADTWYALLGYTTDVAVAALGIKGPQTGNYRICGPGPTSSLSTSDYFINMSERHGAPYIPCINANDRAGTFVSAVAVATGVAVKAQLILAELDQAYTP